MLTNLFYPLTLIYLSPTDADIRSRFHARHDPQAAQDHNHAKQQWRGCAAKQDDRLWRRTDRQWT